MSSAQVIGQWLGVTLIGVFLGYIGYRVLRLALWIRDLLERRRRSVAFAEVVGEKVSSLAVGGRVIRETRDANGIRVVEAIDLHEVSLVPPYQMGDLRKYGTPGPFELIIASPPCEPMARGSGFPQTMGTFRRREYPAVVVTSSRRGGKTEKARLQSLWELAHERPYSTPPEAMLFGFAGGRNGEIAIGARLDWERSVMDGDRPSSIEPRGIFH